MSPRIVGEDAAPFGEGVVQLIEGPEAPVGSGVVSRRSGRPWSRPGAAARSKPGQPPEDDQAHDVGARRVRPAAPPGAGGRLSAHEPSAPAPGIAEGSLACQPPGPCDRNKIKVAAR